MRLLPFLAIIAGLFALLARILSQDVVGVLLSSMGAAAAVIMFIPSKLSSGRLSPYVTTLLTVTLVYLGIGGVQYGGSSACAEQTLCYGFVSDSGCVGISHTSRFSGLIDCAPVSVRIPPGFSFCSNTNNVLALTVIVVNDGGVPVSPSLFSSVEVDGINVSSGVFGRASESGSAMNILNMYNCGSSCGRGQHVVRISTINRKKIETVVECK